MTDNDTPQPPNSDDESAAAMSSDDVTQPANSDAAAQSAAAPDDTTEFPTTTEAATTEAAAAEAGPGYPPLPATATSAKRTWRKPSKRAVLLAAGGIVALLVGGVGGFAIGAGASEHDGDHHSISESHEGSGRGEHGRRGAERNGQDENGEHSDRPGAGEDVGPGGAAANRPSSEPSALSAAAEKAITKAKATGATSIAVEKGGYAVTVRLTDGTSTEVYVSTGGQAKAGTTTAGTSTYPVLDLAKLPDLVQSALTGANSAGGTVRAIATGNGSPVAYQVTVRLPGGQDKGVQLASDLAVVTG